MVLLDAEVDAEVIGGVVIVVVIVVILSNSDLQGQASVYMSMLQHTL
jgi:hypothetical protein